MSEKVKIAKVKIGVWLFFGVFLWGIPVAVSLSAVVAFVNFTGDSLILQAFQQDIFWQKLYMFIPIFTVLGVIFGLIFAAMGKD